MNTPTLPGSVTITAKRWWTSKIFWAGIVQVLIGLLQFVSNILGGDQATVGVLGSGRPDTAIDPAWGGVFLMVIGVLTSWWRTKTDRPIAMTEKPVEVPRAAS